MPQRRLAARTDGRKSLDELQAEAQRLRVEFVNVDMDMAFTFANLARRELETGECHHFDDLIDRSYRVVETVESLMKRMPADKARAVRRRLDELRAHLWRMETAHTGTKRLAGHA